jgi:hypothetical protein
VSVRTLQVRDYVERSFWKKVKVGENSFSSFQRENIYLNLRRSSNLFPNHFWWFSLIFIKWKSLATDVTPDIFEMSRIFQRFFVYFFIFFQKSTTNLADLTLGTSKDILVVSHSLTPHLFQICLIPSSFFNTYL